MSIPSDDAAAAATRAEAAQNDATLDEAAEAGAVPDTRRSWLGRLVRKLPVVPALAIMAALDASLLPNPLEPLLVAGMLTKRRRIWPIAIVATLGCMAGAALSYLAGVFLLDAIVQPLLERLGGLESFEQAKQHFREDGALALFIITMTPIPLPFAPLGAGATGMNPILAIGLIGLFRGFRYFTIAALAWYFEPVLRDAVKRVSAPWATWISLAIGVAALLFLVLR
jgi:membrane protein YqaA with SNARE-associated domain